MFPIDFFHRAADLHPGRMALAAGEQRLTHADLRERASALAAAFQAIAAKQRLKVALLCPNSIDLFLSIIAIHGCAAVLIPLNPRNTRQELESQMALVQPDVLVVDASCLELLPACSALRIVAGVDRHPELPCVRGLVNEFAGQAPVWPDVAPEDDYAIKFTGGSSGRPKGVRQSFRSHVAVILHVWTGLGFREGETYVCAAPMTHGAGSFILPVLAVGGCVVVAPSAQPDALLDTMERSGATATWVPPTLLYRLIEEQKLRARQLPFLRHLVFGGAPTAPEKIDEGRRVFGDVLETTFGQTEASTIATVLRGSDMADASVCYSAGRACALVQVRIVDSAGQPLPSGGLGEIVVRGDLVMTGYLGMPEETARTLVGGWLHTGDIGYLDERGFLFVKDRIRDVVITGGFNVYPSDVEAALARHPAVRECVVFGLPDPHWGERVEAAVELHSDAAVAGDELVRFVKSEIGSVKAPKYVHVVGTLPRSPVGKVLRREARSLFSQAPN